MSEKEAEGAVITLVELQEILDPDAIEQYRVGAKEQMLRYGGEIVARGGRSYLGEPPFKSVTLIRWPSEQAFLDWQESAEFQPFRALRDKGARLRIAIVPS